MEKNQIRSFTPFLPCHIETQIFIHKFLIVPSCPTPFMNQDMKQMLGMVLVMGHLPGLLMLLKEPQKTHEIPLEVGQQVCPSAWYDGIPGMSKTVIPIKIQLRDSNNYPNCKQYPFRQ
jgi:hypothetical protein